MSGSALFARERFRVKEFVVLARCHQIEIRPRRQFEHEVALTFSNVNRVRLTGDQTFIKLVETIHFLEEGFALGVFLHKDQVNARSRRSIQLHVALILFVDRQVDCVIRSRAHVVALNLLQSEQIEEHHLSRAAVGTGDNEVVERGDGVVVLAREGAVGADLFLPQ